MEHHIMWYGFFWTVMPLNVIVGILNIWKFGNVAIGLINLSTAVFMCVVMIPGLYNG